MAKRRTRRRGRIRGKAVANFQQFSAEMEQMAKDVEIDANTFKRRLGLEVLDNVIRRSPVDTGRFRGNWQVSLNKPASSELARKDTANGPPDNGSAGLAPRGDPTFFDEQGAIGAAEPGDDIYINNNVPYAQVLEEGMPGGSKQAPQGIVARTIADIQVHHTQ